MTPLSRGMFYTPLCSTPHSSRLKNLTTGRRALMHHSGNIGLEFFGLAGGCKSVRPRTLFITRETHDR